MNTGTQIKNNRIKKGWTQDDLSDKTGISVRTIQRIEQGKVQPRSYSLKVLSTALEIDLAHLISHEEVPKEKQADKSWLWLPLLHFSGLFLLLIPPMIVWAFKRDEVAGMREAGAEVINFQLTMLAVLIPAGILAFTQVTIPVCIFIGVYSTVVIVINTILTIGNLPSRYPLTYKFISV